MIRAIRESCNRALYGWPLAVAPCVGYIESDYAPGTYYPCATCNPDWQRVKLVQLPLLPSRRGGGAGEPEQCQ